MPRVLVVANQAAESDELLRAVRERDARERSAYTVLIPATPHGFQWAANMDADDAKREARAHCEALAGRLRDTGVEVEGTMVGDPDPLAAIEDACNADAYDELIVAMVPHHVSKWLHLDLPRKAEHATGLPVTAVEAKAHA